MSLRWTDTKLEWHEIMTGATTGMRRQICNIRDGRNHRHTFTDGIDGDAWTNNIEGALGEMFVAKGFGLYWSGSLGNFDAADVGDIEVRTAAKHNYRLILHPTDNDSARWILVTGRAPDFRVQGWILGEDAKIKKYWEDPKGGRPAYFVPQSALLPMSAWE